MSKYAKLPEEGFKHIQTNAGMLLSEFDPQGDSFDTSKIVCMTTGGLNFTATPEFTDFGEDIDNCPNHVMELNKLTNWTVELSGTSVEFTDEYVKFAIGAADILTIEEKVQKIKPRNTVSLADYKTIWWVGDYGEENDDENGGFIAIELLNALATGGFQLQTEKGGKGQSAFTVTAYYSMLKQDEVPFNVYIKDATGVSKLNVEPVKTNLKIDSVQK